MGWTKQQWTDRIRARLGDLGVLQHIRPEQIPMALEAAFVTYANDRPRVATETFAGDGATFDFTLGAAFISEWSDVVSVEYPAGERQPAILEPGRQWILLRDTTTLRLVNDTPATGQNVKVLYTAQWPTPDDNATTDTIPTAHAPGVASLAAGHAAHAEAAAQAARRSSSVQTTLIEANTESLTAAANTLERHYRDLILGRPDTPEAPPDIGYAETHVDHFPSAIFHTRTRT